MKEPLIKFKSPDSRDYSFNPGEIIQINDSPKWRTKVGSFELELDIVEPGIASFVVMEQEQPFLDYVGSLLANAIAAQVSRSNILLVTAETKGSHFVPWVWKNLDNLSVAGELEERVITLRKGSPKVYMIKSTPAVSFESITSGEKQTLRISPNDEKFLKEVTAKGVEPVFVDDFIGRGGTIRAVCELFKKMNIEPPKLAAVIGSDGNLYEENLADLDITLIPQPFPLRLPTFAQEGEAKEWKIISY